MFSRYATVCVFLCLAGNQAQLASSEESVSLQKCREYGKLFNVSADILFPDTDSRKHCNERHFSNEKKAELGEFPYMAALKYNTSNGERFSCVGALISSNYVILPAYCAVVKNQKQRLVSVRFGELSTAEIDVGPNGLEINVIDVVLHPKYNNTENILALVKLEKDVVFTKDIHPICLNSKTLTETAALASGWNFAHRFDETEEIYKNQLLKSKFDLFAREQCAEIYKSYRSNVYDDQICAGFKDTVPEVLPAGTIQVENKDVPCMDSLLGLVSFGPNGPNDKSIPDVYTTIHLHISWIESVVWGS